MNITYLSLDEVLAIHKDQVGEHGGCESVRDWGALESALARPKDVYNDTITMKAAAFLYSLAMNHAFMDGNKRIAFFATDTFLRQNKHFLDCDNIEADRFIRSIIEDRNDRKERIRFWIEEIIKPLPASGVPLLP